MTCIVALKHDGKVYIGGDAAGVGGHSISTREDPKVFKNGDFLIGYTSSFRMGQLLEHVFYPPKPIEGNSGVAYMVKQFIPEVRRCLKDNGYSTTHDGQDFGGVFLVAWKREIYEIQSDYQVSRVLQGYNAVGCGSDIALGSLHSQLRQSELPDPETIVIRALEAAAEFSNGVRGPFTVESI